MIEHVLRRQSRDIAVARAEQRASLEDPSTPINGATIETLFTGPATKAGVKINASSALSLSGVWSAVRRISETIAALPLFVYERDGRGKKKAAGHPLYRVLHDRANDEMTAMQLREMLAAHVLFWGTGYAEIEMNGAGAVVGLWPLLPDRTKVKRVDGVRSYTTQLPNGQTIALPASRVFQITGLGFDGMTGYSLIDKARENLGLTKATEEFGAHFFGQGATTSGVLEHPGKLGDLAAQHLRESIQAHQAGLSNSHRILIAEEGMKWTANSVPPDNAQFLETRKFQIGDVARWFNIPLHMLAQMEGGASFASVEQMSLEFVQYCINPWLVRWEQSINSQLLGEREQRTLFVEHEVKGLMRGDHASRAAYFTAMRNIGVYSANDIRELDGENPIPGEGGDIYFIQGAMIPVDTAAQSKPNGAKAETAATETPDRSAYAGLLRDVGDRMVKRELSMLRKVLKQGEAGWSQAVEGVYRDHAETMARALTPVFEALLAFGSADSRALTRTAGPLALELAGAELAEGRKAIDAAGFAGAEALFTEWESSRADAFAERGGLFVESLLKPKANLRVA